MSTRSWIAPAAAICLVLALASSRVDAAGDAAKSAPLWSGLVPDDAFLAVVAYPRPVLTNKDVVKIGMAVVARRWIPDLGFSPLDLEQVVLLVGPLDPADQSWMRLPQFAIICQLSRDINRDAFSKHLFQTPERFLLAGHRCFHEAQTPLDHGENGSAVCYLDDRTFLYTTQLWLPVVLRAKDAESKLISALAQTDMSADLTMIFTSTAGAKDVAAVEFPARGMPGALGALTNFPDLVTAARLTIQTTPEIGMKLTVAASDEAAAGQIADLVSTLQQIGTQSVQRITLGRGANPGQVESYNHGTALMKKFLDQFAPQRSGKYVTIEVGHLGTVESFFDKVVMPPVRAQLAAAKAEAARMEQSRRLKYVAMAMLYRAQTEGTLPVHAIYSKDGKPLLSWRVGILPMLGMNELYKKFHLDEPWDSASNKPLIAQMPDIFKSGAAAPLAAGKTRLVVPVGEGTLFDGQKRIAIKDITDGLADTVEAIEVGPDRAVTWTAPDDLQFDPQNPLARLGTIGNDGFRVVFANGSAATIRKTIDPETFRRLILRADGHPIDHGKL